MMMMMMMIIWGGTYLPVAGGPGLGEPLAPGEVHQVQLYSINSINGSIDRWRQSIARRVEAYDDNNIGHVP